MNQEGGRAKSNKGSSIEYLSITIGLIKATYTHKGPRIFVRISGLLRFANEDEVWIARRQRHIQRWRRRSGSELIKV